MKLKGVIHKIKYFTIALTLIAIISTPAISDLSQDDLNKIRLLIADELKPIQTEIQTVKTELKDAIASVKEDVASLSGRVDGVEKLITWLMVIIVAIVGIHKSWSYGVARKIAYSKNR